MTFTTAGRREKLPLKEARITIDIGGYAYTGWFVVYKLAKYDLILGKNWMEEVPHHVNLKKNVLWLGKGKKKGRFPHRIKGLGKEEGRREWTLREMKRVEDPHTLFTAASVPKLRPTMAAEKAKPGLDEGKEQEPGKERPRRVQEVVPRRRLMHPRRHRAADGLLDDDVVRVCAAAEDHRRHDP